MIMVCVCRMRIAMEKRGRRSLGFLQRVCIRREAMEKFGFDGSCFAVGSSISVIGGFQDWNIMSSVSLIDCGSHTAQVGGFGHASH